MEKFKENISIILYLESLNPSHEDFSLVSTNNKYLIKDLYNTDNIYFLNKGIIAVEVDYFDTHYISTLVWENDFFGLDSFSSFSKRTHSIKVLSPSVDFYCIKKHFLINALQNKPDLYELLLVNFADALQRHYLLTNFLTRHPKERLRSIISYLGDFIGEINKDDNIILPKSITQQILAQLCRTSQSRISITLEELMAEGFIKNKTSPIIIL